MSDPAPASRLRRVGSVASRGLAAATMAWLVIQLLRTWIKPMSVDEGRWVKFGVGLILLEFLFVHSAPFIGIAMAAQKTLRRKLVAGGGFVLFYALFAVGMILSIRDAALIWVYLSIMLGRVAHGLFESGGDEVKQEMSIEWALSAASYLVWVTVTLFLPLPHLGLPPELGRSMMESTGEGAWEDEPHRAIAAGVCHFTTLGVLEVWMAFRAWKGR